MTSTLANESVGNILQGLLEGAEGPVIVVDPPGDVIDDLVGAVKELEDPPPLRMVADRSVLKDVMGDFLIASQTADLVDGGNLEIRTSTSGPGNALIITGNSLTALVSAGNELGAVDTDDAEFVAFAFEYYEDQFDMAEEFSLRTPPLTRVRETLREDIGAETADDFDDVLASLETARGNGNGLDEVTISLLVAAKNNALLYDISKWGEDVGIASKATFSRTKTKLEDMGLLDTEKVPIDVGRPRLRLKLAHEKLHDADSTQLASVAQTLLA